LAPQAVTINLAGFLDMVEGELVDPAQAEFQLWDARLVYVRSFKAVGGEFRMTACLAAPALAEAVHAARQRSATLVEVAQAEAVMAGLQASAAAAQRPRLAALCVQVHHDAIAALVPALTPQRYAAFRAVRKAERESAEYEAEESAVQNILARLEECLYAHAAGFRVRVDVGLLAGREAGGEGGGGGGGAGEGSGSGSGSGASVLSFPHGAVTVLPW
jgi:hypothetical protein